MADHSAIEWTDATWNPVVGCSVVSPGCTNCYAMGQAHGLVRRFGSAKYAGLTRAVNGNPVWTGTVRLDEAALAQPLRWRKGRRIFVNSMSDLFHEALPDAAIDRVFAVMALASQHTFQVLTKRSDRMRAYLTSRNGMGNDDLCRAINAIPAHLGNRHGALSMPLPNVWLGVSVEDQARADERIPALLRTPAAVRFLSCEPLLGPVDLDRRPLFSERRWLQDLDWVIAGGESGPKARPMHPDWPRSLRDQCSAAGVPFFFKQWGEWAPAREPGQGARDAFFWPAADDGRYPTEVSYRVGKRAAGRVLDGRTHDAFPREPGEAA